MVNQNWPICWSLLKANMNKEDFIKTLKDYKSDLTGLTAACRKTVGNQIQAKGILEALELDGNEVVRAD